MHSYVSFPAFAWSCSLLRPRVVAKNLQVSDKIDRAKSMPNLVVPQISIKYELIGLGPSKVLPGGRSQSRSFGFQKLPYFSPHYIEVT